MRRRSGILISERKCWAAGKSPTPCNYRTAAACGGNSTEGTPAPASDKRISIEDLIHKRCTMNLLRHGLAFLLLLLPLAVFGQKRNTLSGYMRDSRSNES